MKYLKNAQLIVFYVSMLVTSVSMIPTGAQAQQLTIAPPTGGVIANIPALIGWAIQILFVVAGLVAFVYLLLGGIKWITSGGDKGQVEAARNQIIQALIGLVVVFAAWGMIVLVETLLNIGLGFSKPVQLPSSANLKTIPEWGGGPCPQGQTSC